MNFKNVVVFIMIFPISIMAQKTDFSISGTITGLADSTLVFLNNTSKPNEVYATDYSKGGKFLLKGQLWNNDLYQLSFIGYKDELELFMGAENVIINGLASRISKSKISGSKLNADYTLYNQRFNPIKERLNKLANTINKLAAGKQRDSLVLKFNVERKNVVKELNKFIAEKPNSEVTAFVLYVVNPVLEGGVAELEQKYALLKSNAKKSIYASIIEGMINDSKIGGIGTAAIDFVQNDTSNVPVSLSSFKGKYVLVDFWASWCRPCRIENPNVVEAYNRFKDKNFTVLGVSLDQTKENWIKAIKDDKLTWTHVSDLQYWNNAVAQKYQISSIPQNLLISPEGIIIDKNLRGEDLIKKLESLIK